LKVNNQELTTERGCFNCKKLEGCQICKLPKTKEQLEFIHRGNGMEHYRYGCCCRQYEGEREKEQVQFT